MSARRVFHLPLASEVVHPNAIRGAVFIEAEALMRLVSESIGKRREFRLAEVDRLLFGNKIIAE